METFKIVGATMGMVSFVIILFVAVVIVWTIKSTGNNITNDGYEDI